MAEDSGRLREECAPAHTGSGRHLSATSYRVAKRSPDRSSARRPYLQRSQWHPGVAKGAFVKAKGAVLGNIKCAEEAACLQLGCRLSSLFLSGLRIGNIQKQLASDYKNYEI